jgi:hypothetical protein
MPLEIGAEGPEPGQLLRRPHRADRYYRSCRVKQDWLKSRCWNRIVFWWLSKEKQRQELGFPTRSRRRSPRTTASSSCTAASGITTIPHRGAGRPAGDQHRHQRAWSACEKKGRDYKKIRNGARRSSSRPRRRHPVVLSSTTRDEKTTVTAVDADGNPIAGADSSRSTACRSRRRWTCWPRLTEKGRSPPTRRSRCSPSWGSRRTAPRRSRSRRRRTAAGISASDRDFQRDVLKQLLQVPQAREAVYNAT